ncbi:MarR family winged helix-turn-helix transcriptional regulator [Bradyrhizobium murdochi]|uniref:MarR family winged helix-turn-helix transcriptional regulator n=1 Tax=Bradyrhizobium murdochi TaxID=1038859 RepID=UPI0006881D87|nr:MarR family winged helix-turn-helix transcriptional regulator [Bradyrhizobium murdochi]
MSKRDHEGTEPLTVLASHRVPAHLARRFHQICLGVTAEILDGQDITPIQWGVMAAILEEPGTGQKHIAKRVGIDPVTLGQMIDALEKKGLVKRQTDPGDRRGRQLFLTRRGTELRLRLRPSMLEAQERLLAPLTKTERAALLDMLARVVVANGCYARPGNGRQRPRRRSSSDPAD